MNRFFIILLVGLMLVGAVGALVWEYYGSDLSSGTYEETLYNSSGQYVFLNYTDATNTSYVEQGNYTSDVIDFSTTTGFREIKWQGYQRTCPDNMSYIDKFGGYCIDQYEAYNAGSSIAGSAPGQTAWVSISQINARTYCANAGKHLCTSEEWLGAANIKGQVYYLPSGDDANRIPADATDATACVTYTAAQCSGSKCPTGSHSDCVSEEGVYDMIGNVYEWVNETLDTVKPCNSGSTGYCYPNSTNGWQTSADANTDKYGDDGVYFLAGTNTDRAVARGGDWGNGANAGLFCALLYIAPSGTSGSVGFRCCSSPES